MSVVERRLEQGWVQDGAVRGVLRFLHLPDECVYDHAQLKPPVCSAIDAMSSVAEWERLNEQQIQVRRSLKCFSIFFF